MSGRTYPWSFDRPVRYPGRPSTVPFVTCRRCGYDSKPGRQRCPACHVPLDQEDDDDAA